MEKFKNLYGVSRRDRKMGVKRCPMKQKTRKRELSKSLEKYGNNLAGLLISTIDLAGRVPKQVRNNSLREVTQQVLEKFGKVRTKKRRPKLHATSNTTSEEESSDDEQSDEIHLSDEEESFTEEESFDEDRHLAHVIKKKLIKVKSKAKKNTKKRQSKQKFDSDKELKNVLRQKMSNVVEIESSSEEEMLEVDKLDDSEYATDMEEDNHDESADEVYSPGKFVLLKGQDNESEHESDSKSLNYSPSYSLDSGEVVNSPKDSLNQSLENTTVFDESEVNLEDDEKLPESQENNLSGNTSNDVTQEMDTDIYNDVDDYDPSESVEDMLYDSVFTSTSNNKEQTNNVNTNVLKDYTMLPDISIEAIKEGPMTNGVTEKVTSKTPPAVAKPVEDVVEILSSDDEEEQQPVEKPQPEQVVVTNNEYIEEVSDNIFNDVQFYRAGQHVVVILKHPTKLYFWGKLISTLIFGSVYVLGCNLQKSIPYSIYSPGGAGKLFFETIPNDDTFMPVGLFPKLEKTGMSLYDIEQIVTSIRDNDVILHLQNNSSILTRFLSMFSTNSKLFPASRRFSNEGEYKTTLQTLFYKQEECLNGLSISDSWYGLSSYMFGKEFNAKVLVCGGKGVGKSTLNRFLLNSHVNNSPMIYLDLDIGQPEFGISGTISATKVHGPVFGPSFTHTRTKFLKMRFVSELDVMDNINLYLNSVKKMVQELWDEYADMPWVVNTMGFVKAFGESINVAIIRMVRPSFVVQIHDKEPKNNYKSYMRPELVYSYDHGLDVELSMPPCNFEHMLIMKETNSKNVSVEPKQIRDLNVLSYFSNALLEDSLYLSDVVPQMAVLSGLKIWASNTLAPDLIRSSLNARLIALCQVDPDTPTKVEEGLQIITQDFVVGPVCLGFGIVRGINEQEIFVVTPFRSNGLSDVNCIASCCQTLPTSLFTKYSPDVTEHVSYVSLKRERPVTSQIPKRNFHLQRSRAAVNGKQM